jgi:hypothetical protein
MFQKAHNHVARVATRPSEPSTTGPSAGMPVTFRNGAVE